MKRKEILSFMKDQREQRQKDRLEKCEHESKESKKRLQSLKDLESYTLRNRANIQARNKKEKFHRTKTLDGGKKKCMIIKASRGTNPIRSRTCAQVKKDGSTDHDSIISNISNDVPSTIECKIPIEVEDNESMSSTIPTVPMYAEHNLDKEYWELSPVINCLKRCPHSLYISQKRVVPPGCPKGARKKNETPIFNVVSSILRDTTICDKLEITDNENAQYIEGEVDPYSIISYMADIIYQEKSKHSIVCNNQEEKGFDSSQEVLVPSSDKPPDNTIESVIPQSCMESMHIESNEEWAKMMDDVVETRSKTQSIIPGDSQDKGNDMSSMKSNFTRCKINGSESAYRTVCNQSIHEMDGNSKQSQHSIVTSSRTEPDNIETISIDCTSKRSQHSSILSSRVKLDNIEEMSIKASSLERSVEGQQNHSKNSVNRETTSSKSSHRLLDDSSDDDCSYSNESFSSETL